MNKKILLIIFALGISNLAFCQVQNQDSKGASYKDIILLLDNSGSMKKNDPEFLMKKGCTDLINNLDSNTRLGIYLFDDDALKILPLTRLDSRGNKAMAVEKMDKITYSGAYTNIPVAFERSVYDLKNSEAPNAFKAIIFITDGYIDTGNGKLDQEKRKWLQESLVPDARNSGIKVFGVAFTENADFQLIQEITTKTGGEYFRAFGPENIEAAFQKIQMLITTVPKKDSVAVLKAPETVNIVRKKPAYWDFLYLGGLVLVLGLSFFLYRGMRKLATKSSGTVSGAPKGVAVPPASLIDLDKVSGQDEFFIQSDLVSIGRADNNDLFLSKADNTVSKYNHAQIIFRDNHFYIKDSSKNFTKVNDIKIEKEKEIELHDKDIISFVKYRFQFMVPEDPGGTVIVSSTEVFLPDGGTPATGGGKPEPVPEKNIDENPSSEIDITFGSIGLTQGGEETGKGRENQGPNTGLEDHPEEDQHSKPGLEVSSQASVPEQKEGKDVGEAPEVQIEETGNSEVAASQDEDLKTYMKTSTPKVFCINHPTVESEDLCADCNKVFCKNCLTLWEGEMYCAPCLEKVKG